VRLMEAWYEAQVSLSMLAGRHFGVHHGGKGCRPVRFMGTNWPPHSSSCNCIEEHGSVSTSGHLPLII
jgi:hypothetical protein